MKRNKKMAWLLILVMVIVAALPGNMQVKAAITDVSFSISISIEEGANAPDHYGIDYQVVDSNGDPVTGNGYSGNINESGSSANLSLSSVDESYGIKFTVQSAGLSIRLDGNDVTSDGWDTGKTVPVSEVNGKNYAFALYQGNNGGGENPPGGTGNTFDGSAYFVWEGANGALCSHRITGLEASRSQGDVIAFDIIYIPVSDMKDDITGEQFLIGNKNYYWVWGSAEQFILDNNSSYGVFLSAVENLKEPDEKRNILIDPCGAENGESTVCTNGDRQFRATIYNDRTFEGVAFSQNEDDYTYFPSFWDNVFFTNTVDISETTAANPAIYEAFLLEPKIHFGMAAHSVNEFTGIRALNVPDGAVTITKDAVSGYNIEFGSNFFDNVVFEITTAGGSYYLEIVRTAIKAFDTAAPGVQNPTIVAEIYYDSNESYSDYEVYATVHYSDGKISMKKMTVSEITVDGVGNTMPAGTYEMDAGKELKCAHYSIAASDDIVGVDFNAIKGGALSGNTYGGSYFGSNKGVYYDVAARRVIY